MEFVLSGWVGALVLAVLGGDDKRRELVMLCLTLLPVVACLGLAAEFVASL